MNTSKQTRLEQLQRKTNGIGFIKSYPILTQIKGLTPTEIRFIELVLSYQDNGNQFQMKYITIAEIFNLKIKDGKCQTVKDMVGKLKRLGIFVTDHKKHAVVEKIGRGSSTALDVDLDVLIGMIETTSTPAPEQPKEDPQDIEPYSTPEPEQRAEPIEVEEVSESNGFDEILKRSTQKEQQPPAHQPEPTEKDKLKELTRLSSLNAMQTLKVNSLIDSEQLQDVEAVTKEIDERYRLQKMGTVSGNEKIT